MGLWGHWVAMIRNFRASLFFRAVVAFCREMTVGSLRGTRRVREVRLKERQGEVGKNTDM